MTFVRLQSNIRDAETFHYMKNPSPFFMSHRHHRKSFSPISIAVISVLFLQACSMSAPIPAPAPSPTPKPNPSTPITKESQKQLDDSDSSKEAIQKLVDANNQFAFEFFANIKDQERGNIFFSPYSISTALAMTAEGARGATAEEIQKVFHLPADDTERRSAIAAIYNRINTKDAKYQLNTANALWAQKDYSIQNDYLETVEKYYGGRATNLDFAGAAETARLTINQWVEDQTNDKIKNLFEEGTLDELTRLVLVNAVYFKGTWDTPFDKANTKDEDFTSAEGQTVKAPMMAYTDGENNFNYGETEDLQLLEMRYEGKKLSMLVLLPKNNDISALEKSLTTENLKSWKEQMTYRKVNIFLPKFKTETKYNLNDNLMEMGMPLAFQPPTPTSGADFTGMTKERELYIGVVVHQAFVEVNEEGTEAAAATGIGMRATSAEMPKPPVEFKADHPFIFLIQEMESGNILFMGRVMNPGA